MSSQKKDLIGYEPIFAVHCPFPEEPDNDLHVVKVNAHYSDGTYEPQLIHEYGFKRPFYVTKRKFQDHKEKKTYEEIDKLDRYESTQTALAMNVAKRLGRRGEKLHLRQLADSQYLYGTDILSTSVLVHKYRQMYKEANASATRRSVAVLDIEWSVIRPDQDMTVIGLTMGEKMFIGVNKFIVEGYANPKEEFVNVILNECSDETRETILSRGIKNFNDIDFVVCENEVVMLEEVAKRMHAWKPDYIGIWNIDAELSKFEDIANRYDVDLADIFSDPSVPKEYRYFIYKRGRLSHQAKSGKSTTFKPEKTWHTVYVPASFYFVCMMRAYAAVRQGQPGVKMTLDATIYRHLKKTKLKYEPASAYSGTDWFAFMETKHPFMYAVYNLIDCISPELLDQKLGDLGVSLPTLAGISDLAVFTSNPKTLADDVTIEFAKVNRLILASTPSERYDPFKGRTVDQRCIIVTLDTSLRTRDGMRCVIELPNFNTNVYAFTFDCDVTTAYPGNQILMNMAQDTTWREVLYIHGVCEQIKREQSMNLAASAQNNALEITQELMGAPTLTTLLKKFKEEHQMA